MRHPKIFGGIALLTSSLFAVGARAEGMTIEQVKKESASRIEVNLGFVTLKNSTDKSSVSGVSGGAGFVYGFTSKFGIQGRVQQAFATSGFSSLFTALEVGGTYAILGSLKHSHTTTLLGGVPVYDENETMSDTLRLGLIANQYFLNGSSRVLGLAGIGAELKYDYALNERVGLTAGAKFSLASNGSNTITPLDFSVGLLILMGP